MQGTIRMRIPTNSSTKNKRTISTKVDATKDTVTYYAEIELPIDQVLSEEIKRELISDLEQREKYHLLSLSESK